MHQPSRTPTPLSLAHVLLVLFTLFVAPPFNSAQALDCSQVRITQRDGVTYADPSPTTRLRIKGNEVAVRLVGAFETNDSLFEILKNENQAVHLIGKRSGHKRNGSAVAVEILALRSKGKLLWTAIYNGETGGNDRQLVLSNLAIDDSVSCEMLQLKKKLLTLDQQLLGSTSLNVLTRSSTIPEAGAVYERLGLSAQ